MDDVGPDARIQKRRRRVGDKEGRETTVGVIYLNGVECVLRGLQQLNDLRIGWAERRVGSKNRLVAGIPVESLSIPRVAVVNLGATRRWIRAATLSTYS